MIKAIIFDFGNVLLNLNPEATALGFSDKLGISYDFISCGGLNNSFQLLETDDISPSDFINAIHQNSKVQLTDLEVLHIWNSMLLDVPKARLEMLKGLRTKYKVYLLSNTNRIHIDFVNKYFEETYPGINFEKEYFDKVYYSFRMKDRKPNHSIYKTLLKDEGLEPGQTIFIDDNEENILAAKAVGMNIRLHNPQDEIVDSIESYIKGLINQ